MESHEIVLKVTLNLDGQWPTLMSKEELTDYLMTRMNSSLGFRGQVKKLKLVKPRAKKEGQRTTG